ncbi:ROK family transcriptional regulator [Taklimakanibacter lacteus]|uniref:ROK family transcriptional regulator n=1 Tax=Taklimakanibacter lacteus TaxID=2268456 RepID=UPI000E66727E
MSLRGTNQESGRPYNRRIVLETIRLHGPIARGEIARRVGLTVQTVSTIIRELELQDFIKGAREEPKGRGYPATALTLNPEGGFAIGANVSPIGVDVALINLAGDIIGQEGREIVNPDPDRAFAEIARIAAGLRRLRPAGRMLGLGMAMPGPFDVEAMSFVGPTTLQGWKDVPIAERLAAATGLPAFVGGDVASAALSERLYGAGRNLQEFYYLYLGVGTGGRLVHGGQVLRGARGNAGEIGHVPFIPDGEYCPSCGNRGCLERYLSVEAFDRRSKIVGEDGWIKEAAPLLRTAILAIENLFDPETIIFGGLAPEGVMKKLARAAEPLLPSVSERRDRKVPRFTLSITGKAALLRGAAALAFSNVLAPRIGTSGDDDNDPLMQKSKAEKAA